MLMLLVVFIITILSGIIAVTGGNGLILMPALLMLDYDIKDVLVLIRISAVIFVLFNLVAMLKLKAVPRFDKKDLLITGTSVASVILSILVLSRLDNTTLMFLISIILTALFLMVIFKPEVNALSWLYLAFLPLFAGLCGSAVGGAGLIITILYTLLGLSPLAAVQKRIIPSLVIQVIALLMFMSKPLHVDYNLLWVIVIGTAIAGYFNMKIFINLSPRNSKILFFASFIFSISNLLEDAIENILASKGLDWGNLPDLFMRLF